MNISSPMGPMVPEWLEVMLGVKRALGIHESLPPLSLPETNRHCIHTVCEYNETIPDRNYEVCGRLIVGLARSGCNSEPKLNFGN